MIDTKLITFMKLYETKSYTKTAEVLYITQPSLTHHIKTLEKNYNIKLFINNKSFKLTKQGQLLYDYAMQLLTFDNEFENMMTNCISGTQKVNFAVTPGVMNGFLKWILPEWTKQNMFLDYSLEELAFNQIEEHLQTGTIDFAIIDNNFNKRNLNYKVLHKTKLILAVGKKHHFADKKKINFETLRNERFFIGTRQSGKRIFFENELKFRNCNIHDIIHLNELNDPNIITSLVMDGIGVSVFYESEIENEIKMGKLIPIELTEIKNTIEFTILYSKTHLMLPIIEKIAQDFVKIYKELNYLKYNSSFK